MAILPILEFPDPRLRKKAQPVQSFDALLLERIEDMFETLYAEKGVGLAATQVNIHERIIVMDVSETQQERLCVINPEILQTSGQQYETEGCLSFPTLYDKVERAATIRIRAFNEKGIAYEIDAEGLLAVCIQHEIDHLNGILFIDHLSKLKNERLRKKLEKNRRHSLVD